MKDTRRLRFWDDDDAYSAATTSHTHTLVSDTPTHSHTDTLEEDRAQLESLWAGDAYEPSSLWAVFAWGVTFVVLGLLALVALSFAVRA